MKVPHLVMRQLVVELIDDARVDVDVSVCPKPAVEMPIIGNDNPSVLFGVLSIVFPARRVSPRTRTTETKLQAQLTRGWTSLSVCSGVARRHSALREGKRLVDSYT